MTEANANANTNANNANPGSTQSQSGGTNAPSGGAPEYTREQVDGWRRDAARAQGMQGFYDRASKLGFKEAKDFDRYEPVFKTLASQKIDPAKFAAAFEQQHEPGDNPRESVEKMEALFDRKMTEIEKQWIIKQAQAKHDEAFSGDIGQFTKENIKSWLGENYDESMGEMARLAAIGNYLTNPELNKAYPEDHPMAGRFMPPGQEGIAKIKSFLADSMSKTRAAFLSDVGKAASKSTTRTAAGNGSGGGKVEDNNKRPNGLPSRERVEAAFAARAAARGKTA